MMTGRGVVNSCSMQMVMQIVMQVLVMQRTTSQEMAGMVTVALTVIVLGMVVQG